MRSLLDSRLRENDGKKGPSSPTSPHYPLPPPSSPSLKSGGPCFVFVIAFKPIPLRWVGIFCLASFKKQETHGTQSMGFEFTHQLFLDFCFSSSDLPSTFVTLAEKRGSMLGFHHSLDSRLRGNDKGGTGKTF